MANRYIVMDSGLESHPFPATTTLIRGRVVRGAGLTTAKPIRWARLFATTPTVKIPLPLPRLWAVLTAMIVVNSS